MAASTQNQAFNALIQAALPEHLAIIRRQHDWDLTQGLGRVPRPAALARKYPNADREWGWQWVFPAPTHYFDPQASARFRFHLHETTVQMSVLNRGGRGARRP